MSEQLALGARVPNFDLEAVGGSGRLADYAGRWLVIYFYPKDDTPGCTRQAIDFSTHLDAFAQAGAAILGISKDALTKHEKFTAKHDLKIALASDLDGSVCEAFGVWVEKKMYGKTYMGIERSTFLIAPDQTLQQVWRKVRVKDHAGAVLKILENAA